MEVILLERIEKLGQMGDVVSVKAGFARNFLLPQGKALRASDNNKKMFEAKRAQLEAEDLKRRDEAQAVADKMGNLSVVLIRQAGDAGQLYGSVNARDIADSVTEAGFTISRAQVALADPIKTIGMHDVRVNLHGEVAVTVTANVARSADEAETQEKTGAAVLSLAQQEALEVEAENEAEARAAVAVAEQAEEIFEEGAAEDAIEEATASADEEPAAEVASEDEEEKA